MTEIATPPPVDSATLAYLRGRTSVDLAMLPSMLEQLTALQQRVAEAQSRIQQCRDLLQKPGQEP